MLLLLRSLLQPAVEPPVEPPVNGPSGGANWLAGYRAKFDHSPKKRRRNKRDDLLFIRA